MNVSADSSRSNARITDQQVTKQLGHVQAVSNEHCQPKVKTATESLEMIYRCPCGESFQVAVEVGGVCQSCGRRVSPMVLRIANSATLSIEHLDLDCEFHDSHESALDLSPGTMLGHFRLEKVIGRGGMGAVYRALDTSLQRFVAVKVIRPSKGDSEGIDERVASSLREAVAQARLNHPHVVTIYYVGRHKEEPFLAMELVNGPTLAECIRTDGPLRYDVAIRTIIDVVHALQHASLFDIIHADIKPSNLLLCLNGTVKLSDFGLARMSENASDFAMAGTPAYLAPELIDGAPISIQSDMYAIGVTFFELVFGRLPFSLSGANLRAQLLSLKSVSIDFPSPWPTSIPKGFVNIIERLLAKRPEDRYENYDSLLKDLRSIQPASTTIAGIAARVLAYSVDQTMLLLSVTPFAALIIYLESVRSQLRLLIPLLAIASLIVPALYLFLIWRGWSSLGRYLFQLRITEENGLPPGREQLLTREILRNMLAWLAPIASYFSLFYSPLDYILLGILATFLLSECVCVFMFDYRRTLHDMLCHSRVVLDVRKTSSTTSNLVQDRTLVGLA